MKFISASHSIKPIHHYAELWNPFYGAMYRWCIDSNEGDFNADGEPEIVIEFEMVARRYRWIMELI